MANDDWTKDRRKLIILTGGIASGKSNVSRDLEEYGVYHTIDADKIAKHHALNCQRMDATYPADMRAWVVNTNGTQEETREQVLDVWNQIQKG